MNFKTMSPITILLIVILALVGTVGVIYAIGQLAVIPGNGTVITTAAVTALPATLEWGNITQNTSKNITVTLTNIGGTDTGTLLITTTLPPGLSLTYDSAAAIPAGKSRPINFTLTASPTVTLGNFTHVVNID